MKAAIALCGVGMLLLAPSYTVAGVACCLGTTCLERDDCDDCGPRPCADPGDCGDPVSCCLQGCPPVCNVIARDCCTALGGSVMPSCHGCQSCHPAPPETDTIEAVSEEAEPVTWSEADDTEPVTWCDADDVGDEDCDSEVGLTEDESSELQTDLTEAGR